MNKLNTLFLLLVVTLASCDGRDRAYLSNKTVLEEHQLFNSFSEQVKFTPKEYTEIQTDTVLSNQFKIKIKYYSLENDVVIKTHKTNDNQIVNHYHNNFEAHLKVWKQNNIISDIIINKHLFYQYETNPFWANAIMQFAWVDYEKATEESINLNVSFCSPDKNTCKDFTIIIHENGDMKIEKSDLITNIT